MSIAENIAAIRSKMDEAARSCGRDPKEILLCAATKMNDADAVRQAIAGGVDCCGENRVQELVAKQKENAYEGAPVHFIGHLQSNKAAKAVEYASWIHSVDSLKLLTKLDRLAGEMGKKPVILLEVNSGEASKSGVEYSDLSALAEAAAKAENLQFRGLMTMAPLTDDRSEWLKAFQKLADARDKLEKSLNITLPELSMGMSGDFHEAVHCGSTVIRIGTRLFGNRQYKVEL